MKTIKTSTALAAFGLLVTLGGCGGGADSVPTLTARSKRVVTNTGNGSNAVVPKKGEKNGQPKGEPGTFKGRIVYDGPAPSVGKPSGFNPTDAKTDKFCVGIQGKITDQSLIVGDNHGLQNVLIYLKKKPAGYTVVVPKTVVEYKNENCMFVPRLLPVIVNRTIRITNKDKTNHNTHIHPLENPAISSVITYGKSVDYQYKVKELIPVKVTCDIHGWMFGYHLPLDHEFFAVTKSDGSFEIKNLPAGNYEFVVWHERSGYLKRRLKVSIKAGETNDFKDSLKYSPSKFAVFNGPAPKTIVLSLN